MKTVSLLCRGTSLGYISNVPKVDHSVIVNSFHYEVENIQVHEYLSACSTVTHVLSLAAYFPNAGANDIYKKYNFDKIVLPYVKEVSPPIPNHILQIEGRGGILPVKNLDDINKEDMISHPRYAFTSPTSGLDALLYIVNELEPDEVNIVGLDFYDDTGYLTNSNGRARNEAPTKVAIRSGEPTDKMQEFFLNFVKKKSSIKFNLYTTSKIKSGIDNLKVKKVMP
ncbi:hypothetical protein HOE22_02860 [Candidatus Woesearchaeota archaeon]|jgi:hypothetical protein|nr:hypothetical protein [Candidatus Woesearchaeota archaeon]